MKGTVIPPIILGELQRIRGAEAILFTGSRMNGKATKNSDWDFFVILKDGAPRWRKTYAVDDTWIELLCNDEKQIKKEFEEDEKEGRGVTTHMFATGHVVRDSTSGVLRRLTVTARKNWERGPAPLSKQDINFINYDISTYIQDIEDCLHDANPAHLLINYAVNEFVNYFFRLRREWLPRPKDRLAELARRSRRMTTIIEGISRSPDWRERAGLAVDLGKMLGRTFHLSLDGSLYIPQKREKTKREGTRHLG